MKKTGLTRALSVALGATLLLGTLAGCGGGGGSASDFVYVPEYKDIEGLSEGFGNVTVVGDTAYFTTSIMVFADGTPLTDAEKEEYNNYWENYYSTVTTDDMLSSVKPAPKTSGSDVAVATEDAKIPEGDSKYHDVDYTMGIRSVKLDGTGLTDYPDYVPPENNEEYGYAGISNIFTDPNGKVWVLEENSKTIFNLPADFNEATDDRYEYYDHDEQNYTLKRLGPTGTVETTIDLNTFKGDSAEYFYIYNIAFDAEGNFVFSDDKSIYLCSPEGELLGTIAYDGWIDTLFSLDGQIYIKNYMDTADSESGSRSAVYPVDIKTKSLGKEVTIPSNASALMPSYCSDFDFCYNNGTTLYGGKLGQAEGTKILSWLGCDMDSDGISYCAVLENGDVKAICNDYTGDVTKSYIVTLTKTPASEVKQKTNLTMACMWVDYDLRAKILEFNKTDPDYRIDIVDYSEFNTDKDYTAGLTKLNTEIIAGNAPDMIAIDNFSYEQYAAKGLLEDLMPYLNSGSGLSAEDFIPSILKIQQTGDKLYSIGTGFQVSTLVGSADVLGEGGWTMQEMRDILAQHPEADQAFGNYGSREGMFTTLLTANYENYIDWNTGKCSFDSEDFIGLLNFCNSFPTNDELWGDGKGEDRLYVSEQELVATGRQLVTQFGLWDFTAVQETKNTYGDNLVFKGYPCADRNGTTANIYGCMAMTSTCKDKDAAWKFISSLYTEQAQENQWNGMPVIKKVFDNRLAEAMKQEYDENGNPISTGGWSDENGNEFKIYAVSQEEADMINALVDSVARTSIYDDVILTMINDSAAAFFDGSKSAETVAKEIQSKMTLYINEKR